MSETEKLIAFAKEMVRWSWEGIWGGDEIQEAAEKHGLIRRVPFDPKVHKDPEGLAEAGDWWYVFDGPLAPTQKGDDDGR